MNVATKADIAHLEHEIELMVRDLTIWTGGMVIILFTALMAVRFFGH